MSGSPQHKALLLDKKGAPFRITDVSTPSPSSDEVIVRVAAIAINPVDWSAQETGIFLQAYPASVGEDIAGTVISVGSSVSRFKEGDRVLGHSQFLVTQNIKHAGFQEIVAVPEGCVAKLPDNMKEADAVALPLAISTAAAGLYQPREETCLGLDLPKSSSKPTKSGKTLLIWGGSSSVGTAAIQLAVASGLEVASTCSKRNFELVEKLGAKAFDYNSLSVVGDLVEELQKGDFVGAYNAIGNRESCMQTSQVVAQFGGGVMVNTLPTPEDIPATVQAKMVLAFTVFQDPNKFVGKAVYEDFLPGALASGQFVPAPPVEVFGHGLEAIEGACQKQKAGVSGKKIVVTL